MINARSAPQAADRLNLEYKFWSFTSHSSSFIFTEAPYAPSLDRAAHHDV